METQQSIAKTLAEARANGVTTPCFTPAPAGTWSALDLGARLLRMRIFLSAYFISLAGFWGILLGALPADNPQWAICLCVLVCSYIAACATAYSIQCVLYEAGLQKHGSWRVWIAALLLNPFVIGWYVPVSTMWRVGRLRKTLAP